MFLKHSEMILYICSAILTLAGAGTDSQVLESEACNSGACFQDLKGALGDCSCNVDTIDYFNNVKIFPRIDSLVLKDYFRFYKVNLKKSCPFWVDDSKCAMRHCHIKSCPQDSVPRYPEPINNHATEMPSFKYSRAAQNNCVSTGDELGYLNMTISAQAQSTLDKRRVYDEALASFCLSDDSDPDAEYVDLTLNPERYTGYQGPSAHRTWRSIYEENCFRPKQNPYNKFPYVASADMSNMCLEKRVFYRALSGLHTSINIHLCARYLLSSKNDFTSPDGVWGHNVEEFQRRFDPSKTNGEGPKWLKNLYFVYLLEMRALAKAGPYLEREEYYTGNDIEDEETRQAIKSLLDVIYTFPNHFNETTMFNGGDEATKLKEEFREHFRNISKIMDCVGCDKCKLWGKLQTQGLGTALKILFSGMFDSFESYSMIGKNNDFKLTRMELVSLFNAFGRLSNSIRELENFRELLSDSNKATKLTPSSFGKCSSSGTKPNNLFS